MNQSRGRADVKAQLDNDHRAELVAVAFYNKAVSPATELGDHGTRDMLTSILKDEEDHVDWIEGQLDQIKQMGLPICLAEQAK
jgi:bacterioferritin